MLEKEDFINILEKEMSNQKNSKNYALVKDLSDAVVFCCIYAGNNKILDEKCYVCNQGQEFKIYNTNKKNSMPALTYSINCEEFSMKIVLSSTFYQFEKFNEDKSYKYIATYFFDNVGNFIRKSSLVHTALGKQQILNEICHGNCVNGIYYAKTNELITKMQVEIFKLPNDDNSENVYYNYTMPPETEFMCRARSKFKDVPFLEAVGLNNLSILLSEQFEDGEEPLRIEDKVFFGKLLNFAKQNYILKK